ncbi:hypothetical protein [Klebsiella pneumoniae]
MDTHTCLPLLYPLQYLVDHLALRTAATQSASLQAIKFFYEFWYQKHGVTFCFSFYSSNHNPLIAIDELTAFFHYLENGHSCLQNHIVMNTRVANAEAYIYAAIKKADRDSFTVNEIASIVVGEFLVKKNAGNARTFVYHQFQKMTKKGLLVRKKMKSINQFEYTLTNQFLEIASEMWGSASFLKSQTESLNNELKASNTDEVLKNSYAMKLNRHRIRYETELAQVIGEKEVFDEIIIDFPEHELEFMTISDELNKQAFRLMGKISAIGRIKNQISEEVFKENISIS